MEYVFGTDGSSSSKEAEAEGGFMSWFIGCGGGSSTIYEEELQRQADEPISNYGLCGSGLNDVAAEGEAGDAWSAKSAVRTRERIGSYDGQPPRILVLGGSDEDQVGGVGRDLLIPRGASGSVVLNNVRLTVFDQPQDQSQFQAILSRTAAAIISVDVTELYWTVIVRRWADRLRTAPEMPVALLVENDDVHEGAVSHHVAGLREVFENPFVGVFFKSPRDETSACVDSLLSLNVRGKKSTFM